MNYCFATAGAKNGSMFGLYITLSFMTTYLRPLHRCMGYLSSANIILSFDNELVTATTRLRTHECHRSSYASTVGFTPMWLGSLLDIIITQGCFLNLKSSLSLGMSCINTSSRTICWRFNRRAIKVAEIANIFTAIEFSKLFGQSFFTR